MIPVIRFPKKCPHCGHWLCPVEKMTCRWLECYNDSCPFLLAQTCPPETRGYLRDLWIPTPYKYAFNPR